MNGLRSVLAVGAGFFTISVLGLGGDYVLRAWKPQAFGADGSVSDPGVLAFTLLYTAVFGAIGGYLAARIAIVRPLMHAAIVGSIMLALSALAAVVLWDTAPAWYHVAALVLALPAVVIGGKYREMQLQTAAS